MNTFMRNLVRFTLVAALSAALGHAAPLFWVQAQVQVRNGILITNPDTGQQQAASVTVGPVGFNIDDANGTHNANITATAALGHLFGSADAFDQFVQGPIGPNASTLLLRWADTITPLSPTLPDNTFVEVLATLVLSDTLTALPATCCSNANATGFELAVGDQAFGGNTISHTVIETTHLFLSIGNPIQVGGSFFFDAGSSAGNSPGKTGGSTVNADLRFFLDPLTPDVSLSSASGASYASAVAAPEPGAGSLLLTSLLAMPACLARVRRRVRCVWRRAILPCVAVCALAAAPGAVAGPLTGSFLFYLSGAHSSDTSLVLGLQGGGTVTLHTSDSEFHPGTFNQGWWSVPTGAANFDDNDNYGIGFDSQSPGEDFRNYFTFDLSNVSGTVTSATLNVIANSGNRLLCACGPNQLLLTLSDVSTDALSLNNKGANPNFGINTDLGTGNSYGSFLVDTGLDPNTVLSFSLNSFALADIQRAQGGFFSVGGSVPAEVPEPATYLLIGAALIGVSLRSLREH